MARGYGRILSTAKVQVVQDLFDQEDDDESDPNKLVISEYENTEDLKEKSFDSFMESVLDAFNFNLDPSDPDKLDVLNLRNGKIWDLENYHTRGGTYGIDLLKNANYLQEGLKTSQVAAEIDRGTSNPLSMEVLNKDLVIFLNEVED